MREGERACVYTCLFGQYEQLTEQDVARQSSLPFICFTDDPKLTSETWRIVVVEPLFPADPIRSQRAIKIQAHKHLPDYDLSIYIDTSVTLKVPPERLFDEILGEADIALLTHVYETTLEEFIWVAEHGRDDPMRVYEQLNHYVSTASDILYEKPYQCSVLFRRHLRANMQAMQDIWLAQVLRYSRRDQLSFNYACRRAKVEPRRLMIDFFSSWFHSWKSQHRNRGGVSYKPSTSYEPLVMTVGRLQDRARRREELMRELEATINSRSVLVATARTFMRRLRWRRLQKQK